MRDTCASPLSPASDYHHFPPATTRLISITVKRVWQQYLRGPCYTPEELCPAELRRLIIYMHPIHLQSLHRSGSAVAEFTFRKK